MSDPSIKDVKELSEGPGADWLDSDGPSMFFNWIVSVWMDYPDTRPGLSEVVDELHRVYKECE